MSTVVEAKPPKIWKVLGRELSPQAPITESLCRHAI